MDPIRFFGEPGRTVMPYGYTEKTLGRVREVDGVFYDDATDIERMCLLQMEEHGIETTNKQSANA